MILSMVFRHLKSILTFVFLNMFVTLRICGEIYVNVAHLLFFFSCLCVVWCVLSYVLSGVLIFALLSVGNRYVGLCAELLTILFFGVLN